MPVACRSAAALPHEVQLITNFRGVLCLRCRMPIPVSSRVVSFLNEGEYRESTRSHTFTTRCKLCEHESIYSVADVRIFDGDPRMRSWEAGASNHGMSCNPSHHELACRTDRALVQSASERTQEGINRSGVPFDVRAYLRPHGPL